MTRRLQDPSTWSDAHGEQQVALMRYTTALEKSQVEGATWFDCFKKSNLRRTEIVSSLYLTKAIELKGSGLHGLCDTMAVGRQYDRLRYPLFPEGGAG